MLNKINMLNKFNEILENDLNINVINILNMPTINALSYNKEHFFKINDVLFFMSYNTHLIHHQIEKLEGSFFYKITPWFCENIPNYIYVPYIGNLSDEQTYLNPYDISVCLHKHLADLLFKTTTIFLKNVYYAFELIINKYLQELTTLYDMKFTIEDNNKFIYIHLNNKNINNLLDNFIHITNNNIRKVVI